MEGKLTSDEALAVQILERDPNWQKFKKYVIRKYLQASNECETCTDNHRHHQGRALELKMMVNIESKANNILNGS